jgi:hypothetical protein
MKVWSLFLLEEFSELRITCCQSFLCILLFHQLRLGKISPVPDLASLSALLFLDVIEVRVTKEAKSTEDSDEVTLALVV